LASTDKVYKDLTMVNILVNLNLNKELDVSKNTTAVLIFTTPVLIFVTRVLKNRTGVLFSELLYQVTNVI
jgi:hypothetical protein